MLKKVVNNMDQEEKAYTMGLSYNVCARGLFV